MNKIFNEYSLKARLFPALLCALPFLLIKHFIIDPHIETAFINNFSITITGDVSFVIILMYLLAQINRFISKIILEDKSKFPTHQILLPSSNELSIEFRNKINTKILNDFQLSLPTLNDEAASEENTKIRIKEIVSMIIAKVKDGNLLLQHNIEYGFMRNLIGGSVISLFISLVSGFLFEFILNNQKAYVISILLSFIYLIPVVLSKVILKHYSKEYAHILFREYLNM